MNIETATNSELEALAASRLGTLGTSYAQAVDNLECMGFLHAWQSDADLGTNSGVGNNSGVRSIHWASMCNFMVAMGLPIRRMYTDCGYWAVDKASSDTRRVDWSHAVRVRFQDVFGEEHRRSMSR